MALKPLGSQRELTAALARMKELILLHPAKGSALAKEKHELGILIEDYEGHTVEPLEGDPVSAILFRMDQNGLTPADLVPYFGTRSRVSEVLARKRPLTLAMIRRLHDGLGIPAEILIKPTMPADKVKEAA